MPRLFTYTRTILVYLTSTSILFVKVFSQSITLWQYFLCDTIAAAICADRCIVTTIHTILLLLLSLLLFLFCIVVVMVMMMMMFVMFMLMSMLVFRLRLMGAVRYKGVAILHLHTGVIIAVKTKHGRVVRGNVKQTSIITLTGGKLGMSAQYRLCITKSPVLCILG